MPKRTAQLTAVSPDRHLNVPVVSKSHGHFGWFTPFATGDLPASGQWTRERLGWQPKQPGLLPISMRRILSTAKRSIGKLCAAGKLRRVDHGHGS